MRVILISILAVSLVAGCSKKQAEVDQLEQELLGSDSAVIADSLAIAMQDSIQDAMDAAAVPEEEEPTFEPAEIIGSGYTVQVAGCESLDYAQHLVDRYTKRGYEPFITEFDLDGQIYYRVRIGQFEGFGQANSLKAELEDKYSLLTWVDAL